MVSSELGTTVTLGDIESARDRVKDHLVRTPTLTSDELSRATNCRLSLKAENLQRTGSFKPRGALNAVSMLPLEDRPRGVVTFSAGNHGQALAWAANRLGIACTVFMAQNAVPTKMEAIRGFGAEIRQRETMQQAFEEMEETIEAMGAILISPFADPHVIAGQGTVGLEILEDVPEVDQLIVPIGGGGLISGVATAVASRRPGVRIVGVEPEGAPTVKAAIDAGAPVRLEHVNTIADGLAAPFTTELNMAIIQRYVDDIVLVTEEELVESMRLLMRHCRILPEPAGAATLAALITGKAGVPVGAETVAVVSGGNVDLQKLKTLL